MPISQNAENGDSYFFRWRKGYELSTQAIKAQVSWMQIFWISFMFEIKAILLKRQGHLNNMNYIKFN